MRGRSATPLIVAGLGVALAFRVGLFNIGGRGQMLVAAGAAGYVGFAWQLPAVIHLIVAVLAGVIAGAIWGGIVGLLKARTGAHEVIVTIMMTVQIRTETTPSTSYRARPSSATGRSASRMA